MKTKAFSRKMFYVAIIAMSVGATLTAQNASTTPDPTSGPGVIKVAIRDSSTGYGVGAATFKWVQAGTSIPRVLPNFAKTDRADLLQLTLPAGEYAFEISAPGYQLMRTHSDVAPGANFTISVFLDPTAMPTELRDDVVASELKDGFELVHGYVVDSNTHQPISGVKLRLQDSGATAVSDGRGHFMLYAGAISSAEANGPEDLRATDSLVATAPGYQKYVFDGLLHISGSESVVRIDMIPGSGTFHARSDHGALLPPGTSREAPARGAPIRKNLRDWLATPAKALMLGSTSAGTAAPLANFALPSSIRVGSNCGTVKYGFGCTTMNSYSLETYVQDGLDKEWIASWKIESLKAGSVAYRSYGAYFAENPICPTANGSSCPVSYDICNTTWCQVFNTKSLKPTVAAAQATASVALSGDGANAFFAEYAANTNAFSPCVDGQAGMPNYSPPAGSAGGPWPCMADPIATGSTGSGHGRGMSQWGSQYWARGMSYQGVATTPRNWQCIVDHYYNDDGNTTGAEGLQRTSFINGPGGDGPIAYLSTSSKGAADIDTVNTDGSSQKQLTRTGYTDNPVWEPGGAKISFQWTTSNSTQSYLMNPDGSGVALFTNDYVWSWSPQSDKFASYSAYSPGLGTQIYTANADGSGRTEITSSTSNCILGMYTCDNVYPVWSPDGTKFAFNSNRDETPTNTYSWQVYLMNADGSGQVALTSPNDNASGNSLSEFPSWSPDGTKIAFMSSRTGSWQVFAINPDGSNLAQLTTLASSGYPNWTADGKGIVFATRNGPSQLFVMKPDGSNQTQLTSGYDDSEPNCRKCMRFDRF